MPFKKGVTPEGAKPYKKGETGNPNGRPKLPDLKEAIARAMSKQKGSGDVLDAIIKALETKALKGDVRAAQELLDRGYGRAVQSIDHTTDGEKITKLTYEVIHTQAADISKDE